MGEWHPRLRYWHRSAFAGFRKLIHSSSGKSEFYDLRREQRNLYGAGDPQVPRLEAALREWTARRAKLPHGTEAPEEVLQRLRSLGYVQ